MRRLFFLLAIISCVCFTSCEDVVDYYLGINQQPELTEGVHTNEFNLFGILRPDSMGQYNKSFVFVQRIWPALSIGGFSIIPDAIVRIERVINADSSYSIEFPLMPPDAFFYDSLYRPAERFVPEPGQHFRLTCENSTLKTATGELVFPSKPEMKKGSFQREGSNISFVLMADTLIEMYEFYLSYPDSSPFVGRIVPEDLSDYEIELKLERDLKGAKLKIYSYENKLAAYIGNSNTSLNFNKYREGFTSLESGYGVFGALNYIEVEF